MTPEQKALARHALGLDGRRKVSYRNRFFAEETHDDYAAWRGMVEAGLAQAFRASPLTGDMTIFVLTRAAAEAALEPGESLDPEDFPPTEKDAA